MMRRIPGSCGVALIIALVAAAGILRSVSVHKAGTELPDGDICTADPLSLRVEHSLAAASGHGDASHAVAATRPSRVPTRPLRLRMDSALSSLMSAARAAEDTATPAQTAPAAAAPAAGATDAPRALAAPAARPPGSVRLDLLARTRDLGKIADEGEAFGARSWQVVPPPPPPPPSPPPEVPRAPPLPFRYMGQLSDDKGAVTYFLVRGTSTLSVSVGENIDSMYRLESAEGGALQFTFVPLKERQSLVIGVAP